MSAKRTAWNEFSSSMASAVICLATEVVSAAATPITAAIITTAPNAARRRKGVVIRDPKETATPSTIVPVLDYEIRTENNKPHYKIIRADETHQLFLRFLSLLRNFDREDLEMLWQIVQERFASSKPKNFPDDFLLTTLKAMFEKLDVEAQVWKNQRGIHGLAKVKS
nr:hypothetical protein [Tanacetum cinerariifolium]